MESKIRLQVVTPEKIFYDDKVERVVFPGTEGEIGVYVGHIPLTTVVAEGELVIKNNGKEDKAIINNGFAEITPDNVTILIDEAKWA